ncbi:hypothetical protein BDF19DRAFT_438899 [Syncephalis fuscata]|nr:hypothetical protein BDF19DRAFT_438899 [Syncephalis fuscata]
MEPFDINIIRQLVYPKESIIASYPGWIAIAIHKDLQVDLLKLSPKNMVNIHSLDLDKNYLESIRFIGFYQHQQQANDIDDGMRETPLKVLQVWNANNCQLLQFVDFNAYWNGRIICMSPLLFNFEDSENVQLFYNSFLKTELREYQYLIRFKIHKAENNEIITRVPLTPDADLMVTDHGTAQITTIISDSFTIPDSRFLEWIDFYSIDSDRILFYCKHRVFDCNRAHWKRYIKVISLSKGVILECNYQANEHEKPVLIPQYNLVAFCSGSRSELVIISLMDGKIQHYIDISKIYNTCCYFQHIIDTKIIGYYYNTNQYCIIDANTGDVNIHTFPIPEVCYCTVSFGHMILMSKETTLIISFVPELN